MQTTLAFLNNSDQINCSTTGWWLKRTHIYVLILCKYCKRKSMLQNSSYNKIPFLFRKYIYIIACSLCMPIGNIPENYTPNH